MLFANLKNLVRLENVLATSCSRVATLIGGCDVQDRLPLSS